MRFSILALYHRSVQMSIPIEIETGSNCKPIIGVGIDIVRICRYNGRQRVVRRE